MIPESINDLSVIATNNVPQGGDNVGGTLDDILRAIQAIMKRDLALKKAETAEGTSFAPTANVLSENVQAALAELGNKVNAINWSSISGKPSLVETSRSIIAGTGLTGGGTLAANRTLNVVYGTTAGTAAQGNDSRITGAAQKSSNLSDLPNKATARSNLGLGNAATRNVGTSSGNVMEVGAFGIGSDPVSFTGSSFESQLTHNMMTVQRGTGVTPSDSPEGGAVKALAIGQIGAWESHLAFAAYSNNFYLRSRTTSGGPFLPWVQIYHSGNLPTTASRWPTFAEVTGKPTNYATTWASVAAKPAQATRWPTWSEVTGKPSTFAPSNHSAATITSGTLNGARMPMGHGGVGTYAFVVPNPDQNLAPVNWGSTVAGSNIRPVSVTSTGGACPSNPALSGTWRVMGSSVYNTLTGGGSSRSTLAVRIS